MSGWRFLGRTAVKVSIRCSLIDGMHRMGLFLSSMAQPQIVYTHRIWRAGVPLLVRYHLRLFAAEHRMCFPPQRCQTEPTHHHGGTSISGTSVEMTFSSFLFESHLQCYFHCGKSAGHHRQGRDFSIGIGFFAVSELTLLF